MTKQIKLMADFDCWPLWEYEDNDLLDNPHPAELPLSEKTIARLLEWQKIYDGIMDWDDPASADFASEEERVAFEREGISLWQQLQKELGDEYEIVYKSELQHRVLSKPEEVDWEDVEIIDEKELLRAAASNPAFDFLKDPEEDIYTLADGQPFND